MQTNFRYYVEGYECKDIILSYTRFWRIRILSGRYDDLGENKDFISISCVIEYVGSVAQDAERGRMTKSCATGRAAVSREARPA